MRFRHPGMMFALSNILLSGEIPDWGPHPRGRSRDPAIMPVDMLNCDDRGDWIIHVRAVGDKGYQKVRLYGFTRDQAKERLDAMFPKGLKSVRYKFKHDPDLSPKPEDIIEE